MNFYIFNCWLLCCYIILSFTRLLKSYSLSILQYRRLLIRKETHGSDLQLMVPYEFFLMTPDSNCTNKRVLRKDSSPGIPWKYISESCESISCCAYRTLFWKHLLNNLILALFIILLSLIYNWKRKNFDQYICNIFPNQCWKLQLLGVNYCY